MKRLTADVEVEEYEEIIETSASTRTEWNQRTLNRHQSKSSRVFKEEFWWHASSDRPWDLQISLAGTSQKSRPVVVTLQ